MKSSFSRRYRRNRQTTHTEGNFFKKESSESSFFNAPATTPFFATGTQTIQRKCDKCEQEEKQQHKLKDEDGKKIQRKEVPASGPVASVNSFVNTLRGGGQTMPGELSYHFKSRMGHDFNNVFLHTGSQAAHSAKSINAKAYTVGNHIVFGAGQYQPDTYEGKKLLAHELVHVAQQRNNKSGIYRMSANANETTTEGEAKEEEPLAGFSTSGQGEVTYENKRDFANCDGVRVQGHTDANYSHTYSFSGSATRGSDCTGCAPANCISDAGTITSTFTASPTITLPQVPAGLNDCETQAVQAFINGTLNAHEQQHVAAFNTYAGTVTTPYVYNGCQSGEDAFIRGRHNAIESARRAASNAASAALDANGANIFTVTCNCPDPTPPTQSTQDGSE